MSDTKTTETTEAPIAENVMRFFAGVFADLSTQRLFEQRKSLNSRVAEGDADRYESALAVIADTEWTKRTEGL